MAMDTSITQVQNVRYVVDPVKWQKFVHLVRDWVGKFYVNVSVEWDGGLTSKEIEHVQDVEELSRDKELPLALLAVVVGL